MFHLWPALSQAAPLPASECTAVFMLLSGDEAQVEAMNGSSGFAVANNIMVTGGTLYPLKVILNDLELTPSDIASLKGKTVLSLAEGYSELLPYLLEQDVNGLGLDIWYHQTNFPQNESGAQMREFNNRYGEYLIQGDARKIPVQSESMDRVVSHSLVNNFEDSSDGRMVLEDAIRTVKVGGEVRIFGFKEDDAGKITQELQQKYSGQLAVRTDLRRSTWTFGGRSINHEGLLVIVRKLSSTLGISH